jgi:hypothetical protein
MSQRLCSQSIIPSALETFTALTAGSSVLAGVGLIGLKEGWDAEKIEDRVYRLQHNTGQIRTDLFSAGGFVGGSLLSFLLSKPRTL